MNRFQTATLMAVSRLSPNGSGDTIMNEIGRATGKTPSLVRTIGALGALTERGYLSYTWDEDEPTLQRSRRLYSPTQTGSRALLDAMCRPTLVERVVGLFGRSLRFRPESR